MPDPSSPMDGAAAGSAMQRAVAAEQDARRAIAEAETAAAAAVEAAHASARAILNAVPGRIMRLRERGARTVHKALATLAAEEAAASARLREADYAPGLLERTVARLAGRLTGGGA